MTQYEHCTLCPRMCGADRHTSFGACGESADLRVARASLHPWEEPCLSGEKGSGTVFFTGCGLGCIFCQNYGITHNHHGKEITTERLAEIFSELQAAGAANINLVTGVHFIPHIIKALNIAQKNGLTLPVVYNSSGYERVETLKRLEGYVDVYLPDYKYFSPALAKSFSHAENYPAVVREALKEMFRQVGKPQFDETGMMTRGMIIRHLVLPGHTDDSMKVLNDIQEMFGNDVYVSIMSQYTPCRRFEQYSELSRKLTKYEYQKVVRHAGAIGITNGFLQSGEAAKESFIPDFDFRGV